MYLLVQQFESERSARTERRRSACLLAPDVRTHHSPLHCYGNFTGVNLVPAVCSGVPLCTRHSIRVPVRQLVAENSLKNTKFEQLTILTLLTSAANSVIGGELGVFIQMQ